MHTAPKGAIPVIQTFAIDWQMISQRDNKLSILMSTFLIRSATSQSSSYPVVLTRLGGPRSRPNPHLKFADVPGIKP